MTEYTGILALDIDGTLNRRKQKISDLRAVIRWCKKNKKLVVIITARPFASLFPLPIPPGVFKGVKIYCNKRDSFFSSKERKACTKAIQLIKISAKYGVSRENLVFIDNECINVIKALEARFPRSHLISGKETITPALIERLFH